MDDTIVHDVKSYADLQGLAALHVQAKQHSSAANKEVAQQFESMFIQMLIKSMREASKPLSDGLMESEQSSFYTDMYDKQLALSLSTKGTGLSKQIEAYLNQGNVVSQVNNHADDDVLTPFITQTTHADVKVVPTEQDANTALPVVFQDASDFVKQLWGSAKDAAELLGTDPKVLIAQAALETNWGKSIIRHDDGDSTHNLFNIKADHAWKSGAASFDTLEHEDGVVVKQRAKFRSYASYADSFLDYAHFLKSNGRYTDALEHASNPNQFVSSLQKAQYATDEKYSQKIMGIYSSSKFNALFDELHLT